MKKLGNILCPITDNTLLKESILKYQLSIFLLFHNIRQAKMVRIFFQTHILAKRSASRTIQITFLQINFTLTCLLCLQIKVWLRKPRKTCELARWKIFEFILKSVSFSLQPFHRFVEIGRIAVLQDGPRAGKIAAIVDVIDQNRVRFQLCHFNDDVNPQHT